MCGIAGLLGADRVDPQMLSRMCDTIAHRGPDDDGQWIDSDVGIGLGHRRLAIVDLTPLGHQPMHSADGRYVISYNGEIYNHGEVRKELEARGLAPVGGWRSHSDTETLVEAIAALGLEAALGLVVGMFAFALWDFKERRLRLVRDRFGEKPLYYGWAGRDFVFASELKAIRVHPRFVGEIDRRALESYAARTYIPAPLSIYRGIFKLEPGCILTVEPGVAPMTEPPIVGKRLSGIEFTRYWSYRDVMRAGYEQPIGDRGEALEALSECLGQAVRGQSVADVPVGAFLSGGVDSSSIVALYHKYSSIPVRTFSIGFEDAEYDEARHAKLFAAHFGTVHHEHIVTVREAREVIPLLPAMYDEPFADSSQIPTHLVSRFARDKVTVALTGDGGDELFGGYNRHVMAPKLWSQLRRLPRPLRAAAAGPLSHIPGRIWNSAAGLFGPRVQAGIGGKVQKGLRVVSHARGFDDIYSSFLDEWSQETSPVRGGGAPAPFDLDFAAGAPDALRMMYCDAVSYLPDDILCKVDRASMAVSLETRVPFLDHRVAALAARIPLAMKVSDGRGKQILRDLLFREAPRELFDRPKSGFAIPVGQWIKGDLRPWAEDLLDPARMAGEGWFDPAIVQRRWRDHLSGQRDSTPALWAVLMFQAWLRSQQDCMSKAA